MTAPHSEFEKDVYRVVGFISEPHRTCFVIPVLSDWRASGARPNILYIQVPDRIGRIKSFVEYTESQRIIFLHEVRDVSLLGAAQISAGDPVVFAFRDAESLKIGNQNSLVPSLRERLTQIKNSGDDFFFLEVARFVQDSDAIEEGVSLTVKALAKYSPEIEATWRRVLALDELRDMFSRELNARGVDEVIVESLAGLKGHFERGILTVTLPTISGDEAQILSVAGEVLQSIRTNAFFKGLGIREVIWEGHETGPVEDSSQPKVWIIARQSLIAGVAKDLNWTGLSVEGFAVDPVNDGYQVSLRRAALFRSIDNSSGGFIYYVCESLQELNAYISFHLEESLEVGVPNLHPYFILLRDFDEAEFEESLKGILRRRYRKIDVPKIFIVPSQNAGRKRTSRISAATRDARYARRAIEACILALEGVRGVVSRQESGALVGRRNAMAKLEVRRGDVITLSYAIPREKAPADEIVREIEKSALNLDLPLLKSRTILITGAGKSDRQSTLNAICRSEAWVYPRLAKSQKRSVRRVGEWHASSRWSGRSCYYVFGIGRISEGKMEYNSIYSSVVEQALLLNNWDIIEKVTLAEAIDLKRSVAKISRSKVGAEEWILEKFLIPSTPLFLATNSNVRAARLEPIAFLPIYIDKLVNRDIWDFEYFLTEMQIRRGFHSRVALVLSYGPIGQMPMLRANRNPGAEATWMFHFSEMESFFKNR